MTVIVYKEFGQEFRRERRGDLEKLELCNLVLEPVADLERTPCKPCVLRIGFQCVVGNLVFLLAYLYIRVLVYPVHVLANPFLGIFLVAAYPVGLAHRDEPFVAVQLPAQLVVLYRPVSPVYVLPVVE